MATIDMAGTATIGHSGGTPLNHRPYLIEREINLATAVTTKGSALAQADVIEALDVPAQSLILWAGAEKVSAMTGTSTDLTFDIGITGVDADAFVDGWDFDAAAVGDYGSIPGATIGGKYLVTANDTIDILFATQTGTVTGGKLRVWAVIMSVNGLDAPGLAAAGS
jgi:hypothetical protein